MSPKRCPVLRRRWEKLGDEGSGRVAIDTTTIEACANPTTEVLTLLFENTLLTIMAYCAIFFLIT